MRCRSCDTQIIGFFSLGKIPLGNGFLQQAKVLHEKTYDLSVGFCPQCFLVQLIHTVPPERLYRKGFYFQRASQPILEKNKERTRSLIERLGLTSRSSVVEIGSHDGAQLKFFQQSRLTTLGVEPASNMAAVAKKKGIQTIVGFFNATVVRRITREHANGVDLIIAVHLLNHISDMKDFLMGIRLLLKPRGTAFFEFYAQRELDIIHHEHIFYFSFVSLRNLFRNAGLEMYDAEMNNGAMRVFVSHPEIFPVTRQCRDLIAEEMRKKFHTLGVYREFARAIQKRKDVLLKLLERLKRQNKKIVAYSAPEKGNILLNYCGMRRHYLDFIVDRSELKQGLYTPGTHFLIYPPERIYREKPDYLLILCWNIAEDVMKRLDDYHRAGGRFILPFPTIQIV